MSIEQLKRALPDYAKDLRLNLGSLATTGTNLSEQQLWGTLLASAIDAEASGHLSSEAKGAVKSAAAIMAMNNIYYRFTHLVENEQYATMPARLRMNVIADHGVDRVDFELWCLAVSAINGCGACVASHERELIEKGATRQTVQDAARVAAVVHAVAATLDAEDHFYSAATISS